MSRKTKPFLLSTLLIFLFSNCIYSQEGDPKLTEVWEPQPKVVTPGINNAAPSDAIILFDGKNLNEWTNSKGENATWEVKDGALTVVKGKGDIITKQKFGSCQLHIEWRSPSKIEGEGQGRGNSGIFLQERYEVQVLDNYNNKTYANGQAASIYKQSIPLANACRKPGEWQTYDIIYTAPKFDQAGNVISNGRGTVIHNGVLVQNNYEIKGETMYIGAPFYKAHEKASIKLQDHGNPVSFRNIWIRELE